MCSDQTTKDTQHAVMASALGSGGIATERNRYFTGKYMSARDFADEQAYHVSHQRLHNRLLHGWGVVCGLRVVPHPSRKCLTWAVVRAGVAMDCYGRDLVLHEDTAINLGPMLPAPPPAPEGETPVPVEQPKPTWLVLGARYKEVPLECVPALYDEGICDPTRHEANRVREVVELKVYKLEQFAPFADQWPGTVWHAADEAGAPADTGCAGCRNDCDDTVPGPVGVCLQPACMIDDVVPLAIIRPIAFDESRRWTASLVGRRELPKPPEFLTHIVETSWPHGGSVRLSQLQEWGGKLWVRFDRKLLPPPEASAADSIGSGVNEFTFLVQYYEGGQQRDVELLPHANNNPPGIDPDDPCVAVFTLDSDVYERGLRGRPNDTLPAHTRIYITLKCDFILDCNQLPVDGNHLGGVLPSGDGVPGGTFESWFEIGEEPAEPRRPAERR